MKKKMQIIICFYQSETGNEKKERNVCHETLFAGLWMILIRVGSWTPINYYVVP